MRVQVDEGLWWDLVDYHVTGKRSPELELRIRAGIEQKLNAMERRALYTASRVAEDPEDREMARRTYLDERGISKDFRH